MRYMAAVSYLLTCVLAGILALPLQAWLSRTDAMQIHITAGTLMLAAMFFCLIGVYHDTETMGESDHARRTYLLNRSRLARTVSALGFVLMIVIGFPGWGKLLHDYEVLRHMHYSMFNAACALVGLGLAVGSALFAKHIHNNISL